MSTRVSGLAGPVLIGLCTLGMCGKGEAQPLGESALGESALGESGMVEVVVSVELSCPSCAQGLERRFSRLAHVERVEIQVDQGRVALGLVSGTTVGLQEVWDVVRNAGFTPDELAVTAVGRLTAMDGRAALGLPDDRVLALVGPRVGALVAAAGEDPVQVYGAVTLATDGGPHVLTVGGFSVP